jgi:hypothetical protein
MKNSKAFNFGIEHEIPLVDLNGNFLDYRKLNFNDLNKIVQKFPIYPSDYSSLRIGDLGIKVKRLYIEGFELFDANGYFLKEYPKGFELRTNFFQSIEDLFDSFLKDFSIFKKEAYKLKLKPTFISFNPFLTRPKIKIELHKYEKRLRREDPGRKTALFTLLTYGPDLNISFQELNDNDVFDIVQKLNYYTPFMVPFSFSSPFYKGKLWNGYSVRIFFRSKLRPACIGFVEDEKLLKNPTTQKIWILNNTRISKEAKRIEYKAVDTIWDVNIYKGLLVLLKGLILESNLKGKSFWPDLKLMEISARYGFDDNLIYDGAFEVLNSAYKVLKLKEDRNYIKYLFEILKNRHMFSKILIKDYLKLRSINKVLLKYDKFKI